MNHVTPDAGALTKRTPHNSRQTKQTATNQQHSTGRGAADKQHRVDTRANAPRHPPQNTHPKQDAQTRKPRDRTHIEHSHGASRRRLRPDATTRSNHTPHGARSLAARNALITAQPQAKGKHPNTPQQGSTPTRATRRAARTWPRQGKERSPRPARQSKGGEAPTDRSMDPSGQQRNRTSPTIT